MKKLFALILAGAMAISMVACSSIGSDNSGDTDSEGKLKVVTAIIKLSTVPSNAPLSSNASATGIVPKISAYMGVPAITARIKPKGFLFLNQRKLMITAIDSAT